VAAALKQVECDPKCGFLIRSHDEKEVIKIAIEHAKKSVVGQFEIKNFLTANGRSL
jgi:predicted small metal-binding protein